MNCSAPLISRGQPRHTINRRQTICGTKTIILNAILDAAREGRTSTTVALDGCLSKRNEEFLKEAHIDWEYNVNRLGGALLSSPTEYAFYWENLKDELVFDEED